jgi:RNA polymerase sigma factor (sigma-70 family)
MNGVMKLTDNELIARYQAGDESALKTLVTRYEKRLFSYILISVKNKELAEDIFQDTFIKVINTIRSGNYHEEGKFFQWIMRIANNLKIDYYRRMQRMPVFENGSEFDIFDVLSAQEDSVEQKIIKEQIYSDLRRIIDYLPAEQKEVLVMRIYQEYSFKEISEITGVSINTALGRMRYALINLRKIISKKKIIVD